MKKINKENLDNIVGGEISTWMVMGIGAVVVFALGFIDGLVHPKGCGA